ncbi:MAG: ABC transporter substrate-binding protein [Oscillospiraceae bacterium]
MKKKLIAIFLSGAVALSLCACSVFENIFGEKDPQKQESSVPEPVVIDPNWPVTVGGTEIKAKPEKVACASPALAEYISDMGLLDRLCAVSDYCAFGGASALPSIGSVRLPDMDTIKELSPQYILTFAKYDEKSLIALQQTDITVIVLDAPSSIEELRELYRELSLFFLGSEEGAAYGESYVAEYDAALAEICYSGEKVNAAFLRAMDYTMVTGDAMENELLSACFENAAAEYNGYEYPAESWDSFKPDVIFVGGDIRLENLETSDLYKGTAAVKGDRVYLVDMDAIALCSRRSFAMVKDMMATVYADYTDGTPLEPAYPSIYKK